MRSLWFVLALAVGCGGEEATTDEAAVLPGASEASPAEIEPGAADAAEPAGPPEPLWLPRGGARLFTSEDSLVRISPIVDGAPRTGHEIRVDNGVVFVADVATLEGAQGVFELGLSSYSTGDDALDSRIRDLFFDTATYPVAYVDIQQVEPVEIATEIGASGETESQGVLIVGAVEVPISMKVRFTREKTGYRIQTVEPADVSIKALGRSAQIAAVVEGCAGVSKVADAVQVDIDMSVSWETSRTGRRIPVRPGRINARLQGDGAVTVGDVEVIWDDGRDPMKDPMPEDLRGGRINPPGWNGQKETLYYEQR